MLLILTLSVCLLAVANGSLIMPSFPRLLRPKRVEASVVPGTPMTTGILFQGGLNAISLFTNIIFFRVALSFFPDVRKQFPILKPVFTVTEPYLKVFRKRIPRVGNFDISAIPAIFVLDLISQGTAAFGADDLLIGNSKVEGSESGKRYTVNMPKRNHDIYLRKR